MKESSVAIDADGGRLLGVLTEADDAEGATGFVMLNAGLTHHVGPQRLHVRLARRLGDLGFSSVRFDHTGIGDSPRRRDAVPFAVRSVAEARAAMDYLHRTRGIEQFVLLGLCWGADNVVRVAAVDERAIGVVAVDFYAVSSARYLARFYLPRLFHARSWAQLLRGRSAVTQRLSELLRPAAVPQPGHGGELLPVRRPGEVLAELDRLAARGVRLCFAYAHSGGSYDQYVRHFRRRLAALEAAGAARIRVFRDCDHVFTPMRGQAALCSYIEDWARGLTAPV